MMEANAKNSQMTTAQPYWSKVQEKILLKIQKYLLNF